MFLREKFGIFQLGQSSILPYYVICFAHTILLVAGTNWIYYGYHFC